MNNFTQKELDNSFSYAWDAMSKGTTAQKHPKAYILGGLPGSGKSMLGHKIKHNEFNKNAVMINGDELREYHPNIKEIKRQYGDDWVDHTQAFLGKMVEKAIDKTAEEKRNAVVEGTFRQSDAPINTLQKFKSNGYQTNVALLAVDKNVAWQGTLDRYQNAKKAGEPTRATPRKHFDTVVSSMSKSADTVWKSKAADNFYVYTRESLQKYEPIYDSNKSKESPQKLIDSVVNKQQAVKKKKFTANRSTSNNRSR